MLHASLWDMCKIPFFRIVRPPVPARQAAAAAYLGVIELEVSHAAAAGRASEQSAALSVCLCLAAFYAKRTAHDQQSRLATLLRAA